MYYEDHNPSNIHAQRGDIMFHSVVQVIPYEDYKVYVYFEDGKIVCYDAKPLLAKKHLSH